MILNKIEHTQLNQQNAKTSGCKVNSLVKW